MKLVFSKSNPPLGGFILAEYLKSVEKTQVEVEWGEEMSVGNGNVKLTCQTSNEVLRAIARLAAEDKLYGTSALEKTETDQWLTFAMGSLVSNNKAIVHVNKCLAPVTYLVGKRFTIADAAIFSALFVSKQWQSMLGKKEAPEHVLRWYNFVMSQEWVKNALNAVPDDVKSTVKASEKSSSGTRQQEGKFVELPGAEMGKVVVRFPPEASGYLHIGHAKAALLNQYYQQAFDGKLIMRFDDTNPAKEDVHFEQVILQDVDMLQIKPDMFTHTSQYFDLMLEYCERLLKDGKAYVDDTDPEKMKLEREQRVESANRSNTYEKNLSLWEEMKKGSEKGQRCCVRAKIDMQSPNGCMRDPTIYRCKNEPHPRTGTQYKVYPTYDFACPIVDAIEGVTHTLRTMEYHDRDPQFYWFIEALGLRKPYIWEYSRLSMTNTVLSKRKLAWFVEQGIVDGWDDPRFPTVRGVLRRGMTVEGLKEFIVAQGSSRSVVFMEWDKIWSFNKKVIDPVAPRYTALDADAPVPITVSSVKEEKLSVPKHPKNTAVGTKDVWVGPRILIDRVDAELLKENENTTFINWGNLLVRKICRENGKITSVEAEPNLDNKDYKKTLKLTWLAETEKAPFTPAYCVYFDHIISKALLAKDEDFKQYVGHKTRVECEMLGDPELRNLKKGDIIQLQRRGFFIVDVAYQPADPATCREQPIVLFNIPDGHTKENPMVAVFNKVGDVKQETPPPADVSTAPDENSILEKIAAQGDKIRDLKSKKADKQTIEPEVKALLALKADYKSLTGKEWKPGTVAAKPANSTASTPVVSQVGGGGDVALLSDKIAAQGDKVRLLKLQKADKGTVDGEVKILLGLKTEYKALTGKDWKPEAAVTTGPKVTVAPATNTCDEGALLAKIAAQGEKVRDLKAKKAEKAAIDGEVKTLLALKGDYKTLTGKDWKPGAVATAASPPPAAMVCPAVNDEAALLEKIASQGDKVREIKAKKADKATVDAEVKVLLALKADYKTLSGKDWKPGAVAAPTASTPASNDTDLSRQISEQGDKVRDLKGKKADKATIDAEVKVLLTLKADYKTQTGKDWAPQNASSKPVPQKQAGSNKNSKPPKQQPKPSEEKQPVTNTEGGLKKQTRLGMEAKKEENLADWYSQVITKGEMIEYYDVSGCYIFRPWSFAVWEAIRDWFDAEIKKLGVQNCYFPIFVSRAVLEKEKTHIADFAPEVAWVTRSGSSEMAEPIAVRPTSETVMYPAYARWIQSFRDLPIKLNQWNNVVRWEFKHPQPFLRTREFLWQEGHTAHALKADAEEEVLTILELYAKIYTDLLAIPVVRGRKTEKEKFAGGDYTYTVEAFVSASGRAIQGATSHHLGQNFSKMFDIVYEDAETQEKRFVYQNSWGITTRTIGVMIMVHADNQGLVLPPRVASIQVVVVPCGINVKLSEADRVKLRESCQQLEGELSAAAVKVKGDYRDNYSPGWKFNHWELKGVPVRVELGPKDIQSGQLVAVRRDTGEKVTIKRDVAVAELRGLLDAIQQNLYAKACKDLTDHLVQVTKWPEFAPNLDKKNLILSPFCGDTTCEDKIKADSARDDKSDPGAPSMGAKSLCIPMEQPAPIKPSDVCIHPDCKNKPKFYTLFGRSY